MLTPAVARILVVEDDPIGRLALRAIFEQAGYEVLEAGNGEEALRLAGQQPSLMVLDVNLPDINGFEVCRRIKADPATHSIAILHLSAVYTESTDRSWALEHGAEAYLTKPVDPNELLATVRALLRLHRAQQIVEQAAGQWRLTFDALADAICLLDPDGTILRCNRSMAELLGRSFAELVGQPYLTVLQDALHLEQMPVLLPATGQQRGSRAVRLGERWFLATNDPIAGPDGWTGLVHILSDVSQRTLLEDQLRQKQKMDAFGRLAGGVAHDFNNLLAVILGNVSLVKRQVDLHAEDCKLLTVLEETAWRGAELTRHLLGFSRQPMAVPVVVAPTSLASVRKDTILVADDNEMLRKLASTILRHNGYQVLLAADGQEAIAAYKSQREQIALVLLDVMMPGLSGWDALRRLRQIDPGVRVVLASGFADVEPEQAEGERIQGFVTKPYRERDLIAAVRAALDPAPSCPVAS